MPGIWGDSSPVSRKAQRSSSCRTGNRSCVNATGGIRVVRPASGMVSASSPSCARRSVRSGLADREAFRIFPWGEELLDGLLGNDVLGFHIQYHCNNFMDTNQRKPTAGTIREVRR